jgi:ubiquinone/menaquinone biosynthesis C-methylase UbiE
MNINPGLQDDLLALQSQGDWVGRRVVDVGCGRGELAAALSRLGADVLGVEPNPERLASAPPSAARMHLGSASTLPCTDASTDAVIFNRSLHHVPPDQLDDALAEAIRVLAPGGALWALEPDPDGTMSRLMEPFHDERRVRRLAQQALDRARPRFADEVSFTYTRPHHFKSLQGFREAMTGAGITHPALHGEEVAARFATGTHHNGRVYFHNPILVRILQRAT